MEGEGERGAGVNKLQLTFMYYVIRFLHIILYNQLYGRPTGTTEQAQKEFMENLYTFRQRLIHEGAEVEE